MAKGLFTQCLALLTDGHPSITEVESTLRKHDFVISNSSPANENWAMGGPSCLVPFRPEVNGYATVDVVNHPWPDAMGDPKSEPLIFAAWSLGNFGPSAYPGGLARAGQQSWSWSPGKTVARKHQGLIRVRLSYAFGAKKDDLVFPKDCDPMAELDFLSRVLMALFEVPGTLCYFNPNGEVLRDGASFSRDWNACRQQEKIPLHLWSNIRLFNLDQTFCLMDTIGNDQLNVQDVEAIFPKDKFDLNDIDHYLRNVTLYILESKRPLLAGETIDGPGETNLSWIIRIPQDSAVLPPRRTIRIYPKANEGEIQKVLTAARK